MLRIFLSELAENKLDAILDYLVEEWSKKSSDDFFKKFEDKLNHVASFPESCTKSKKHHNLYLCVVTKQTSFLYRIKGDEIEIITVLDNRSSNKSINKEIRKYYGSLKL